MIIKNSRLARFLKQNGIVLLPFIFIAYDEKYYDDKYGKERCPVLIRHESIHYRQQIELFILGIVIAIISGLIFGFNYYLIAIPLFLFYGLYLLNYILNIINPFYKKKLINKNIVFEKEAYDNENNKDYLKTRPFLSVRKYIFGKTIR